MLLLLSFLLAAGDAESIRRTEIVRRMPGFVALWDFVKTSADGRFDAYKGKTDQDRDFRLDAVNYVRDYWNLGRSATYADFPMVKEGPFGRAIEIRDEKDPDFRPLLMVPRARLHDSGLDRKGPGQSVTLVAWVLRKGGNHAIAGIWHEGTDLHGSAAKVERGMRQYALFAGLAANPGASAAHVSENGAASFGDKYARNLSVTPEKIPDGEWAMVGLVFDNRRHTVTSYLNGKATEYWIENPEEHPFFQWAAKGWREGTYQPPKGKFTKVKEGKLTVLKVNPFWFPHDLYAPATGGPFTIGRVIHSSRSVGFIGLIGGVAVFSKALSSKEMDRLAFGSASGLGR